MAVVRHPPHWNCRRVRSGYAWTGVDFRMGKMVWSQLVGTGLLFDSYVPGPAIGPNGALYVGAYGGTHCAERHVLPD